MKENFEANLEAGVWKDLLEPAGDEEEEEGENSQDSDPEAEYGSEDGEDDEYGSDDSSDYEEESSALASENDLSEEGLSWDELDKQAEEEDRKMAAKRGTEKGGRD